MVTQPYYTLNGGETWNPIILPGVTSWSGFDAIILMRELSLRTVCCANTFYLYYPGDGVYETTNGGADLDASL